MNTSCFSAKVYAEAHSARKLRLAAYAEVHHLSICCIRGGDPYLSGLPFKVPTAEIEPVLGVKRCDGWAFVYIAI